MKVLVVLNPECGSLGRYGGVAAARERIEAALAAHAVAASTVVASGSSIADEVRRASAGTSAGGESEFGAVLVGGGDGSVSAAASVLAGGQVPLAVLPLGTFNHFARSLDIPADLDAAVALVPRRRVRRVDVGEVNGRIFVNNSSIGFYPRVVILRRWQHRRGWSRWIAIPLAFARVLWRPPVVDVEVAAAGRSGAHRTHCLVVGNNLYHLERVGPPERSRLDRGELAVYITNREGRLALLDLAWRAFLGRLEPARDFTLLRVATLRVTAPRPRLRVALDGETMLLSTPLDYRIRPGALPVIAP